MSFDNLRPASPKYVRRASSIDRNCILGSKSPSVCSGVGEFAFSFPGTGTGAAHSTTTEMPLFPSHIIDSIGGECASSLPGSNVNSPRVKQSDVIVHIPDAGTSSSSPSIVPSASRRESMFDAFQTYSMDSFAIPPIESSYGGGGGGGRRSPQQQSINFVFHHPPPRHGDVVSIVISHEYVLKGKLTSPNSSVDFTDTPIKMNSDTISRFDKLRDVISSALSLIINRNSVILPMASPIFYISPYRCARESVRRLIESIKRKPISLISTDIENFKLIVDKRISNTKGAFSESVDTKSFMNEILIPSINGQPVLNFIMTHSETVKGMHDTYAKKQRPQSCECMNTMGGFVMLKNGVGATSISDVENFFICKCTQCEN